MDLKNFFAELKRRNVYKVAVGYTAVAWLLIQVATQISPFFEAPNWRAVFAAAAPDLRVLDLTPPAAAK